MLKVRLVQQGAWDMPVDSMPLAVGYLKAVVDETPHFAGEVSADICNFRGGQRLQEMTKALFSGAIPDVLAFSVLGWNYRNFGVLSETFKQVNPNGLVVFGGNHVAYQGERVFREFPWVDVVVNGEGEHTFRELLTYLLERPDGSDVFDPVKVTGLSFRRTDGTVHSTADRDRIADLDVIPSPFLSGAIPMADAAGNFRYDVALIETNRGCPYKCAFCYWGGAVGQKMRSFSIERLTAELDIFGYYQAPSLVLCDSNFGLLEADEEFVEILIKTKEKYGYPGDLITSWAKNKSQRFYNIVRQLKQHDMHSLFTLALQTLDDAALTEMLRKNMKVNQWESLVEWLAEEGLECYGELIWGAPGETVESFLEGYDRLARMVSRIAVYPMLLLPNTSYVQNRELHGFITIRGEDDDFEYVLANRSSTLEENLQMQRFVFWARVLGEQQYLRHVWRPLLDLANMSQSKIIMGFKAFFDTSTDPAAVTLRDRIPVLAESPAIAEALRSLHSSPELQALVQQWWTHEIVPAVPPQWQPFIASVFDYERWSRQVYVAPGGDLPAGWHEVDLDGAPCYRSDPVTFEFDVPAALANWPETCVSGPKQEPVSYVFQARPGYYKNLDNHEAAATYLATHHRL
ncbi:KedN5 family methylcobalamin-dependent radical SAM C-methyltransferase [Micromonospora sp. WMMA1363]|uniref:KedN5 family methylcobalamin-dependent radical SAM C-methyltransferase n=1 Tax=Micromonospora sp. WMMA1363 TaxID=3053985 RepID=UPI00259D173F|nr:KedN5 family methylcobalamin-dependent radical SAM C-methyltransferase [Micromonospora sp. WMMA1363]MDM4719656.1 KedN5 family methylcobalamin-dependent radical SAM C-methyltransferase [Micromonospora sp. WMMA1363]